MGTTSEQPHPAEVLFGKTRRAVLRLVCTSAPHGLYLRQIARSTGCGLGAVQREVYALAAAGILSRTQRGRAVYYTINPDWPFVGELTALTMNPVTHSNGEKRLTGLHRTDRGTADTALRRNIKVPGRRVKAFCRRSHIRKLALFGSVLRDDFRPDSDVDVLVEFEPGHVPGFAIAGMQDELSEILGRRVDLRTAGDLSRHFRQQVIREAQVQYNHHG